VTYCDNHPDLTDDEYLAGQAEAFRRLLPGAPEPGEYTIQVTDQYRLHNRCVSSMRKGRILLAADAAHVCNPFGGYGCMSAVLDVGGLADCLIGLHQGLCDDSILDKWAEIRREKFLKFVDRRSRKNMERLRGKDPEATVKSDEFLKILRSMEGDDEATKKFLLVSHIPPRCQHCLAERFESLCLLTRPCGTDRNGRASSMISLSTTCTNSIENGEGSRLTLTTIFSRSISMLRPSIGAYHVCGMA
jgi:hypothetical protein